MNHTFLTIIPKKEKPQTLTDYKPITCAIVLYKIMTKIICNRIKFFLPYLITDNQSAFILGRSIGENILLAHEMLRDFKRPGKSKMCIKINLQKAYDMINKEFVCRMLIVLGFPNSPIALIYECISTPSFSILVEGSPHGFIHSNRGLRQGDPLCPYLVCIAMEYLSLKLEDRFSQSTLKPFLPFNHTYRICFTQMI